MDMDDRGRIEELRLSGCSTRQIARLLGFSKSQVHRAITGLRAVAAVETEDPFNDTPEGDAADPEDDEDDDDLARLTRMDSDIDPDDPEGNMVDPPLTFVGIEFEGNPCGVARVMDAAGRHVDELRLYRWKWHYDGDGHDAEREAVLADVDRQIAAQGWRQERDGYGHMVWVQSVRSRWPGHTIIGG